MTRSALLHQWRHVCALSHCVRCGSCVEPPRRFCETCRSVFDLPLLLKELSAAKRRIAELEAIMAGIHPSP